MGREKREAEGKGRTGAGPDVAEDFEALIVPAELPGEDGRQHDDHEAVWYISDRGKARLEALLEFPTNGSLLVRKYLSNMKSMFIK